MERPERRCADCKDWRKSCFGCTFAVLQRAHGVENLSVDLSRLNQIAGFEYLFSNPFAVRQPQLDFTFRETQRRPITPRNNEPLASAIMQFADESVLPVPINNAKELALDIYLEALAHHTGLNGLNSRVCILLVYLRRDVEALSFAESLSQWPTMRFDKDIWLFCRDSALDEISGVETLHISIHVTIAIVKGRVVAKLRENQEKMRVFLATDKGSHLEEVRSVLSEYLGGIELLDQERQLNQLLQLVDNKSPLLGNCMTEKTEIEMIQAVLLEDELMGALAPGEPLLFWKMVASMIDEIV